MTHRDAQDLATEFGARRFKGDRTSPAFGCWADRIEWLPRAAERGELQNAIAEANRYAG